MTGLTPTLLLSGHWRLAQLSTLAGALTLPRLGRLAEQAWRIDGSKLESIDTAGALLLLRRLRGAGVNTFETDLVGFSPSHERIVNGVLQRLTTTDAPPPVQPLRALALLGEAVSHGIARIASHLAYLGLCVTATAQVMRHPSIFRWREFLVQLHQTGITSIPVVALVMFLIGAVMAYLLGMQAEQYGANIYVVDGVTLGTVREFAPLLVSTVIAGRSGAAFTAQLGTMRLTEEIDAIRTLGMSAEQVLLLPRVAALSVVLPLLVFVGSVFALAGAMVTCSLMLDITPTTFLERMQSAVGIRHYMIGLLKAPVFAVVIAVIGCAMGLTVSRDTRAIGLNTTSTVVQCIVAVVLLDAVFAILFQEFGW